ncbi:MAG: serine protease DegS, partial [Porticoccaceae bacterium]
VLAIGNPCGVGQTVTQGIVSATRRKVAGGSVWQNFVQIDAAINPGNSGGALINPYGQLVGVNTAVFRGDSGAVGIGFSIPADLLAQVVPQIIENGSVARGWLGIGVEDIAMFPALRKFNINGAVITEALENSPANAGGLQPMDIVVRLGEETIANATQLLLKVSALPPGATVKLSILRSTKADSLTDSMEVAGFDAIDLKVRLGLRPTLTVVR